jgi:hypothetical protein
MREQKTDKLRGTGYWSGVAGSQLQESGCAWHFENSSTSHLGTCSWPWVTPQSWHISYQRANQNVWSPYLFRASDSL